MTHLSRHSGWLWLAAFLCALFPIDHFQLEFFAGAVLLTFGWAYLSLSERLPAGWTLPRSAVTLFAGLFWLLVAASVFWSEIKSVSLIGLCFFSLMPLTFFVAVMARDENFYKKTGYALAFVFGVLSLWAMIQFFFLNEYFNGQARHPLNDPSSLGALFSLALFCALGWVLSGRPGREHGFAVLLSILLVCGIMSTVARGPVFAFIPGIIVFLVLLWPQVKLRRKSLLLILMAAAACYGVMQTGLEKKFDIGDRFLDTVTMRMDDVSNNRIGVWSATLDMIKDRPLLGTGIGTYFLYHPEYRRASDPDTVTMAHNDPLQFWAELGILGPLLFYAFAFAAILRTTEALKKLPPENSAERIAIVSVFAALGAMVAGSHVGFSHYNVSILMLTGLLLAIWFGLTGRAIAEPERKLEMSASMPPGINRALLAAPFLITAWLLLSLLAGEYFVNKARANLFREEMFDFADNINNANNVSHGLNFRAYLLAVNVPMAILEHDMGMLDDKKKQELYLQVKSYMDSVLALNPRMGSAYYYLARVQTYVPASAIPAGTPSPEEYFRKALDLEPLHVTARMELLKIARAKGASAKEQLAILEPGVNFTYTVSTVEPYYMELSRLYLETGNYGKAKDILQKLYAFKKRSEYSLIRQNTSIPQAIMGGDAIFETGP